MKRRHWSTRARAALFLKWGGQCHICETRITERDAWDVSHEIPLELGGDDDDENDKPAHRKCHAERTAKIDIPAIAKAKRNEARHRGFKAPSRTPLPCGRNSRFKRKMDGSVVRRNP
jgi:5-methylcytosine-specific restriction protein A